MLINTCIYLQQPKRGEIFIAAQGVLLQLVISLPHCQRHFTRRYPDEYEVTGLYGACLTLLSTAFIASGLDFARLSLTFNHGRFYRALFRRIYAGNNIR